MTFEEFLKDRPEVATMIETYCEFHAAPARLRDVFKLMYEAGQVDRSASFVIQKMMDGANG